MLLKAFSRPAQIAAFHDATFSNTNQVSINRDSALEMLTAVFPDLKQQWESYIQAEYQNYNKERLDYVVGEIIRYVVEKKRRNETSGFAAFFKLVETILAYGDSYTRELIVIGLLEGIQNVYGSEVDYYTGFNEWLEPETKKAWAELIQLWEGSKP